MTNHDRAAVSDHLGTDRWIVSPRLTDALAECGYRATVTRQQIERILNKSLYIHRSQPHDTVVNQPGDPA